MFARYIVHMKTKGYTFRMKFYSNLAKLRGHGIALKIGCIALGLLVCNVVLGYYSHKPRIFTNLLDYFPEASNDGSRITWAHSTNNRHSLEEALQSKVMILEADVSSSSTKGSSEPVVAHPPNAVSELTLTLEEWLLHVIPHKKGIKLNFKHIDEVEPSIVVIQRHLNEIKFPVLLCADLLQGPTNTISVPLNQRKFLYLTRSLPDSILSLGWTTFLDPNVPNPSYSRQMVEEMIGIVKNANVIQAVTFSVRACIAKNSVEHLQVLLEAVRGSTLAVWSSPGDPVTKEDLMKFRQRFEMKQIYYDLSSPLREEFLLSISTEQFP